MTQASPAARIGPRPFPLHLGIAATSAFAPLGAFALGAAPPPTGGHAEQAIPTDALARRCGAEAAERLAGFLAGVSRYRAHPYRRRLKDPPVLWQEGATRLLAYGAPENGAGVPVLLVPSLINRAYILDLSARRSFARYLRERGLCPYLLDWGSPGPWERRFGLDDYILGRLGGALDAAREDAGRPVALLGYCMGGLLALPLARRRDVSALVLLAAPWDFHAGGAPPAFLATLWPMLAGIAEACGCLPTDMIRILFASLDPLYAVRKFAAFAALDGRSAAAQNFVALEDWLNDGVPLASPVARTCLEGWYGANTPMRGRWSVGGEAVRPARIRVPVLNVVPARDRIVPPESAAAISGLLPRVETRRPALGHIGMMASPRAKRALWRGLADWICVNAAEQRVPRQGA